MNKEAKLAEARAKSWEKYMKWSQGVRETSGFVFPDRETEHKVAAWERVAVILDNDIPTMKSNWALREARRDIDTTLRNSSDPGQIALAWTLDQVVDAAEDKVRSS